MGLDVYEEEEGIFFEDLSGEVLQGDELARLLTFPNVLITSHQAFLTREALTEISGTTVANIAALACQEPFIDGSVVTKYTGICFGWQRGRIEGIIRRETKKELRDCNGFATVRPKFRATP